MLDVNALYIGNRAPHILGIETVMSPSLDFMRDAATLGEEYTKACRLARQLATDKYGLPRPNRHATVSSAALKEEMRAVQSADTARHYAACRAVGDEEDKAAWCLFAGA